MYREPEMNQPKPTTGKKIVMPVAKILFSKMAEERYKSGLETYGTPLMTHNGRSALDDALEECFDLWMYLIQQKMEMNDIEEALLLHFSQEEPAESVAEEQKENNDFAHDDDPPWFSGLGNE
jgi:hypothetical protein